MKMWLVYGQSLLNPGASLNDLREAVTTIEDTARRARRVLGGAHPTAEIIDSTLEDARAALRAREASGA